MSGGASTSASPLTPESPVGGSGGEGLGGLGGLGGKYAALVEEEEEKEGKEGRVSAQVRRSSFVYPFCDGGDVGDGWTGANNHVCVENEETSAESGCAAGV